MGCIGHWHPWPVGKLRCWFGRIPAPDVRESEALDQGSNGDGWSHASAQRCLNSQVGDQWGRASIRAYRCRKQCVVLARGAEILGNVAVQPELCAPLATDGGQCRRSLYFAFHYGLDKA